jgi:hypothetical protein
MKINHVPDRSTGGKTHAAKRTDLERGSSRFPTTFSRLCVLTLKTVTAPPTIPSPSADERLADK